LGGEEDMNEDISGGIGEWGPVLMNTFLTRIGNWDRLIKSHWRGIDSLRDNIRYDRVDTAQIGKIKVATKIRAFRRYRAVEYQRLAEMRPDQARILRPLNSDEKPIRIGLAFRKVCVV
jgi:hypothetical protein